MNAEVDVTKLYRARYGYQIKVYSESDGKTILVGKDVARIIKIQKEDNPIFKDNVFPALSIFVIADVDEQKKMQLSRDKNDLAVQLYLSVIYEQFDGAGATTNVGEKILWEKKFQAVLSAPDNTKLGIEDNPSVIENDTGKKSAASTDMMPKYGTVELVLSNVEHRNRFKKILNFNLSSASPGKIATVAGAIAYALGKLALPQKSVVFQQPDRLESFEQIITPPWNFKDFCKHIQTVYGVYKSGLIVYQDINHMYILPYIADNYAVVDNDYNSIHIYQFDHDTAGNPQMTGMYVDKEKSRYVISQPRSYAFVNTEEFLKETAGNKFKIHSPESGLNTLSRTLTDYTWEDSWKEYVSNLVGNKNVEDKTRYLHNELSNEYLNTAFLHLLSIGKELLSISLKDIDFSVCTFNKTYTIHFEDNPISEEKYGGDYQVLLIYSTIVGNQNEPLTAKVNLMLARKPI